MRTVETHRLNIKRKLGIDGQAELIKYAVENRVLRTIGPDARSRWGRLGQTTDPAARPAQRARSSHVHGKAYTAILQELGTTPRARDWPTRRRAKAMRHLCRGWAEPGLDRQRRVVHLQHAREIVLVKNIELYSLCEHHMLPFIGKAVAYRPTARCWACPRSPVSSKCTRAACRSRKTQPPDRRAVQQVTNAAGVAVVLEAQHMCMMMRGVEKQNSSRSRP